MSGEPGLTRLSVPLNALRAFEAAARHLSLKAAAAELGVTASAISHQLRHLEAQLGVDLLRRSGTGLELTVAGQALAPDLTAGFSRITHAVAALRQERSSGPLRLSMLQTFAGHWLSPRLASLPHEQRGFDLVIATTPVVVDLSAGVADVAIRHGQGQWPGLMADRLFAETMGLFAAPNGYAGQDEAFLRRSLRGARLFLSQYRRADFLQWNDTLPGGPISPAAITMVDSTNLALRAAIDGAGFTLAGCELVQMDVQAGRLAPLFAHTVSTGAGYYLVYPPALKRDRRLRNIRQWLLSQ